MMARRGIIKGMLGGVTLAGLSGCGLLSGSSSYRFRMTIEVATPQGLKSGAGVMEVEIHKIFPVPGISSTNSGGMHGEAVVVDCPDGPVFALLKKSDSGQSLDVAVTQALAPDARFEKDGDYAAALRTLGGSFAHAKAELPRADWPLMVRFGNIHDPKSVEKVDPVASGVMRIWVETTSDPVTVGIEKRLEWLLGHHGALTPRLSAPDPANPPFSARITEMDFWTETNSGQ